MAIPPGLERIEDEDLKTYLLRNNVTETGVFRRERTIIFKRHERGVPAKEIGELFDLPGEHVVEVVNSILTN